MSTLTLPRRRVPSTLLTRADEAIELLLLLLTAAFGTLRPFTALHKFVSC